eukprot:TRINITY_DN4216_c0_g1_i7.p1 TRINITY_DN4216_c0_g1~~TRINITY_DN4216_c0_g1_i7.p1  ORF type:complete len:267 (-),score=96.71 TRINITY_DN4216_c0_g1_i7:22-822(-)
MLIYIRGQILGMDYSSAMRRLFKYPPVEDPLLFVEQALNLQQNPGVSPFVTPVGSTNQKSNPNREHSSKKTLVAPADNTVNRTRAPSASGKEENILNRIKSVVDKASTSSTTQRTTSSSAPPSSSSATSNSSNLKRASNISTAEEQLQKMKNLQAHMANRLERIIYSIQKEMLEKSSGKSEEEKMDAIMVAVAEMKQVKDVLSGLLPPESFYFEDLPSLSKGSTSAALDESIEIPSITSLRDNNDLKLQRRSSDPFGIAEFSEENS